MAARVYKTIKGTATFWYQVLDTLHYWRLTLPSLVDGAATIHRRDWTRLFYREVKRRPPKRQRRNDDDDAEDETEDADEAVVESDAANRAWERFKQAARGEGILVDADIPLDPVSAHKAAGYAAKRVDTNAGFIHLHLERSYDGAFRALGAPHPLGDDAEDETIERECVRLDGVIAFVDVLMRVQAKRRAEVPPDAPLVDPPKPQPSAQTLLTLPIVPSADSGE